MKYLLAYVSLFLTVLPIQGQILHVIPENPTAEDTVTIIYHADQGNGALADFDGNVYAHSGVITGTPEEPSGWRFVQGNWGEDDPRMHMERIDKNTYRIRLHIRSFYGFGMEDPFLQMSFVFRNKDGSLVGKDEGEADIFYPAIQKYPNGPLEVVSGSDGQAYGDLLSARALRDGSIFLEGSVRSLILQSYGEDVVRVCGVDNSTNIPGPSEGVVGAKKLWMNQLTDDKKDAVEISWGENLIRVDRSPMRLSFYKNGELLLSEEKGLFRDDDDHIAGVRFALKEDEHLYGTGSRAINIDRRGQRVYAYNTANYGYTLGEAALNISIPFVISSGNYGLYFDNPKRGYFDMDANEAGVLEFGALDTSMSYFFLYGDRPGVIIKNYTDLTGHQPMPPRWALGYIQSRFGYRTQKETMDIVKRTLDAGYPLDAILMDLYWFGEISDMGNLEWLQDSFPDPEKMISDLNEQGVKTILITETYVVKGTQYFDTLDSLGYFAKKADGSSFIIPDFWAGPAGLLDIIREDVQEWFWPHYRKQIGLGIGGLWCDSGEPENHPKKMIHSIGPAEDAHNLYPLYWSKMIYDNHRKEFPDKRLFNLARSGYAGMQRYATFPWSGDVSRSWDAFRAQTSIMLGVGTCGIGYMHSDLGGFTGGPLDEELYRRWVQMGTFVPIMRTHGSGLPSEPVYFSEETQKIVKEAIKLRYRLLPYNYTVAWENNQSGLPLARPMWVHFPEDPKVLQMDDQYMWGNDLLVAPVTESGIKARKVYLPEGVWFDLYSGKSLNGGVHEWPVVQENIPVFVKGGSFIPSIPDPANTMDYTGDTLIVSYYPTIEKPETSAQLYMDDGELAEAFGRGKSVGTEFHGRLSDKGFRIQVHSKGKYEDLPAVSDMYFKVYGLQQAPKKGKSDKGKIRFVSDEQKVLKTHPSMWWDAKGKVLHVHIQYDFSTSVLQFRGASLF